MVTTVNRIVEVLPDLAALTERALKLSMQAITVALDTKPHCSIALAGGNTPKPLYTAIAKQNLPWERIHVFWGDERYVPADHPDSNQRMARIAWLDQVPIPAQNIHPIPTMTAEPAQAAQVYEQELQAHFQLAKSAEAIAWPQFDLVWLGMGPDGHTASLFPHTAALNVCDRLVTVGQKDDQPRITLTAPAINQACQVLFLVTGENKQPALAAVFAPEGDEQEYPSRLIQPVGSCYWLLDQAAGAQIKQK